MTFLTPSSVHKKNKKRRRKREINDYEWVAWSGGGGGRGKRPVHALISNQSTYFFCENRLEKVLGGSKIQWKKKRRKKKEKNKEIKK